MKSFIAEVCGHSFLGRRIGKGSVVLDLGANKGEFAEYMAREYSATVYSVEPVPELFHELKEWPGGKKFNYCIGSETGEVTLSFPKNRCATTYASAEDAPSIRARSISINDFFRRHVSGEVALLKMDIEGAELGVLETIAPEHLQKIEQLTVEFHDFLYPETRGMVREIKKKLTERGFRALTFSFRTNGDVLFVQKNRLGLLGYWYIKYFLRYARGARRAARKFFTK
ncbi:MAG: FkbM family methyltransferase [Patescibacteria group bacterium]